MAPPEALHTAATRIVAVREVGRYALGITWGDGHESIVPFPRLRAACTCEACSRGGASAAPMPQAGRPAEARRLGEQSIFVRWEDGHETLLLGEELRGLCRCALCAGEPERPLSGS